MPSRAADAQIDDHVRRFEAQLARAPATRVAAVDLARTAALGGMIVYHAAYDLAMLGHIPFRDLGGGWRTLAVVVAGSFLFLAGVSLHLAHPGRIRWRAFGRRFRSIGTAALLVSLVTWIALPTGFVFYGILHSIAVASLAAALAYRLPWPALLALAAGIWALPRAMRIEAFDAPWLWWTGLSPVVPRTVDFEPFFPWAAPLLAGLALARAVRLERLAAPVPPMLSRLGWPGRHSLAIYLAHQPVLLAGLYALGWLGALG